jgi:DNA-binding transcriptional ArsR family regulator
MFENFRTRSPETLPEGLQRAKVDALRTYGELKPLARPFDTGPVLNDVPICAVFRALGDPERLWFIEALQGGDARLCELAEIFPITQSTVIHHLRVLEACGLVGTRKAGPMRLYSFRPEGLTEASRRLRHLAGPRGPPFRDAAPRAMR